MKPLLFLVFLALGIFAYEETPRTFTNGHAGYQFQQANNDTRKPIFVEENSEELKFSQTTTKKPAKLVYKQMNRGSKTKNSDVENGSRLSLDLKLSARENVTAISENGIPGRRNGVKTDSGRQNKNNVYSESEKVHQENLGFQNFKNNASEDEITPDAKINRTTKESNSDITMETLKAPDFKDTVNVTRVPDSRKVQSSNIYKILRQPNFRHLRRTTKEPDVKDILSKVRNKTTNTKDPNDKVFTTKVDEVTREPDFKYVTSKMHLILKQPNNKVFTRMANFTREPNFNIAIKTHPNDKVLTSNVTIEPHHKDVVYNLRMILNQPNDKVSLIKVDDAPREPNFKDVSNKMQILKQTNDKVLIKIMDDVIREPGDDASKIHTILKEPNDKVLPTMVHVTREPNFNDASKTHRTLRQPNYKVSTNIVTDVISEPDHKNIASEIFIHPNNKAFTSKIHDVTREPNNKVLATTDVTSEPNFNMASKTHRTLRQPNNKVSTNKVDDVTSEPDLKNIASEMRNILNHPNDKVFTSKIHDDTGEPEVKDVYNKKHKTLNQANDKVFPSNADEVPRESNFKDAANKTLKKPNDKVFTSTQPNLSSNATRDNNEKLFLTDTRTTGQNITGHVAKMKNILLTHRTTNFNEVSSKYRASSRRYIRNDTSIKPRFNQRAVKRNTETSPYDRLKKMYLKKITANKIEREPNFRRNSYTGKLFRKPTTPSTIKLIVKPSTVLKRELYTRKPDGQFMKLHMKFGERINPVTTTFRPVGLISYYRKLRRQ